MTEQNQGSKPELERISLEERLAKWRQSKSQEELERSSYFVFGYLAGFGTASVARVAVNLNENPYLVSDLLLSLEQKDLIKDVTNSFASQRPQQKEITEEDVGARIYQATADYPPMKRYGIRQEHTSIWSVFKMYFKDLFRRQKQVRDINS